MIGKITVPLCGVRAHVAADSVPASGARRWGLARLVPGDRREMDFSRT